jgi:hypothetical protein
MKYSSLRSFAPGSKTFVAIAIAMACGAASATPVFTFSPTGAGLVGANVTADNIILSDFSTVTFTSASTFSETGFLSFANYQLGGTTLANTGLNSTYSLYVAFTGSGSIDGAVTTAAGTTSVGSFSMLDYTLYATNGTTTFTSTGVTSSGATTVALGSGTLNGGSGSVDSTAAGGVTKAASANVDNATFAVAATAGTFFAAPVPFYDLAFATFSNTSTQITTSGNMFSIVNGGGALNFAVSPVPEPSTYALMLAGLAVVGGVARRRKTRA